MLDGEGEIGERELAAQNKQLVPYRSAYTAPKLEKYIKPEWTAQRLDVQDKVLLGLRDLYRPGSLTAILASASYSQLVNGSPNYGTNAGAYGQRLGATALRDTSGNLLGDSVFASLLHQDPRYYIEGSDYDVIHRTLYAITRSLVTRSDDGKHTLNSSLLLGNASASLLTLAYYPQFNRNSRDVATVFGGSIGGAAVGFVFDEFADGFLQALHLEKR